MNRRGVALVEVVVSMLILAVAALAVTATVSMVSSTQMRSAGGSSLDLQALSFAKETLESLKNVVSTDATRALPLRDNTASCTGKSAGTVCGTGEVHSSNGLPFTGLPVSDLQANGGTRTYRVQDISDGNGNYAYKKVTVCVTWAPQTSASCTWT